MQLPREISHVSSTHDNSPASFGDDLAFLRSHVETITLTDASGLGQVAVVPAYQGRVMTSTARGLDGPSFGWINRPVIASSEYRPHIHVYGGEDRFWLGPEGGQYAIYFKPGVPFDLAHWQTPPCIDTEAFELVAATTTEAHFRHAAQLTNYSGTVFDIQIDRAVRLVAPDAFCADFPVGLSCVAYESDNRITNVGKAAWTRERGLLSIWMLGMYPPSPGTTIVLPYVEDGENESGPIVNDAYFGAIPSDRLRIQSGAVFLRGDGRARGKIGLGPGRARNVLGSYDAEAGVLTLVTYNQPTDTRDYVNAMWEIQDAPYSGDVVNAYNDGPPAPGQPPLGPFYELETSSPARALAPGESLTHVHRTLHAQGDAADLDTLARATLGVGLREITLALE